MAKARKDNKGRALRKGEVQRSQDGRYVYTYTNPVGKRCYIYANTLMELREKEDELKRDQLDGIDSYVAGKADLDFLVDRYMATKNNLASSTYAIIVTHMIIFVVMVSEKEKLRNFDIRMY